MRFGAILALCAAAVLIAPSARAADSGTCPSGAAYTGAGSIADPFLIATPGQLQRLRDTPTDWDDSIALTADIDMSGCVWGSAFMGDAEFSGRFDGQGHVIRGLTIRITGATVYAGLFPYLRASASVIDLGFEGDVEGVATGTGDRSVVVGGLAGHTLESRVERSYFIGTVTGHANSLAGGDPDEGSCASVRAGGFIATSQGTVIDSFARATVVATAEAYGTDSGSPYFSCGLRSAVSAGGFSASVMADKLTDVYVTGSVSAAVTPPAGGTSSRYVGAFSGSHVGSASGVRWSSDGWPGGHVGSASGGAIGTGVPAADLRRWSTFGPSGANWSIADGYAPTSTWGICDAVNDGYPALTAFAATASCPGSGGGGDGDGSGGTPAKDDPAPAPTSPTRQSAERSGRMRVSWRQRSQTIVAVVQPVDGATRYAIRARSGRSGRALVGRCGVARAGRPITCRITVRPGRPTVVVTARADDGAILARSIHTAVIRAPGPPGTREPVTG